MAVESHPRLLARGRKKQASANFMLALVMLGVPLCAYTLFNISFPFWVYIAFFITARVLQLQGSKLIGAAKAAELGADGEDKVAQRLAQLPPEWKVERNIRMPGIGDIDFFVQSPRGSSIVLEVKAHKGKITSDGATLCRVWFGAGVRFPKDFIAQATRQATKIRQARKLSYVHAALVFTEAKVMLNERQLRYCHVLQANELMDFLQKADLHAPMR
jgi:hypothetical protein